MGAQYVLDQKREEERELQNTPEEQKKDSTPEDISEEHTPEPQDILDSIINAPDTKTKSKSKKSKKTAKMSVIDSVERDSVEIDQRLVVEAKKKRDSTQSRSQRSQSFPSESHSLSSSLESM